MFVRKSAKALPREAKEEREPGQHDAGEPLANHWRALWRARWGDIAIDDAGHARLHLRCCTDRSGLQARDRRPYWQDLLEGNWHVLPRT